MPGRHRGAAFEVPLTELFAGKGAVELTNDVTLSRQHVRALLASREGMKFAMGAARIDQRVTTAAVGGRVTVGEADVELARRLGVPTADVVTAARRTWGRTLTEERDARVAALGDMDVQERQAHRGHITRELALEIQTSLAHRASPPPADPKEGDRDR